MMNLARLLLRWQQNDNPTWQNGHTNTTKKNHLSLVTMSNGFWSPEKMHYVIFKQWWFGPYRLQYCLPNNIVLLVTINKFDAHPILVNVNKLTTLCSFSRTKNKVMRGEKSQWTTGMQQGQLAESGGWHIIKSKMSSKIFFW